ncbi:hypothetical protein M413DRAFT_28271 [Hebeloma cylindrosporum]|uniref:Uncharacterized protein n=1 Tax=Hebeloma cylindrosporum TaxID=76867 RepID=A0A0C2XRT7_HEBCY|nr:hypothetical protein M413DRAFT_28271 [Hebeloma cylindrosporum h7]
MPPFSSQTRSSSLFHLSSPAPSDPPAPGSDGSAEHGEAASSSDNISQSAWTRHIEEDPEDIDLNSEFNGLNEDEVEDLKHDWERSHTTVRELNQLIPNFQKKIDEGQPEELTEFYAEHGANNARSDNLNQIRECIAEWLNQASPTPSPLLAHNCRKNRGLEHDSPQVQHPWVNASTIAKGLHVHISFCACLFFGARTQIVECVVQEVFSIFFDEVARIYQLIVTPADHTALDFRFTASTIFASFSSIAIPFNFGTAFMTLLTPIAVSIIFTLPILIILLSPISTFIAYGIVLILILTITDIINIYVIIEC